MTTRKNPGDMASNVPFKKPKLQVPNNAPNMWDDDSDDDDLILMASQAVEANHIPANNFASFVNDFPKDARTTSTQQQFTETEDVPQVAVNVALRAKVTSTMALMNQDKASQDYLRRRIEGLEKDVKKSKEECQAALEKFQIKDYEVSSLKYEMKEMQRANNELRLKLVKNDQINREMEKNKAMEKQLQKVETELELKRLELLKLRSDRRMSSSQVMPMDVTVSYNNPQKETAALNKDPVEANQLNLDILVSRYDITPADSWQYRLGHRIFEKTATDVGMGTAGFAEQLSHLQRAMGLIFQGQEFDVTEFLGHTLEGCKLALNSVSMKYDTSNRRSILSGFETDRVGGCIYDKESMFADEELIIFRRILSIFALGYKLSAPLRNAFFESPVYTALLEILNGLTKTSADFQHRTAGVIQAVAVLLLNIVESGNGRMPQVPELFKALSFALTDSFTIYTMLKILRVLDIEVTRAFLCKETQTKTYEINTFNTVHFEDNSCLLQILATAIECVFPVAAPTEYWTIPRYRKLLSITKCLMQFFRKSIVDINSSWLRVDRNCLCYLKLTTSFIILAYQCLHLFHTVPKLRAEMRQIQTVSQLTLLLIHDIFTANLQMKLLHSMGRRIKNRLVIVYNLLMQYNEVFHFRLAQVKALESFEVNLLLFAFVKPSASRHDEQQRGGQSIWDGITV